MFIPLVAALTLNGSPALDVPYLPQTEALCGGAAVAMVYRYWGDVHADVNQFASLVDRRAGGIADRALVEAVRQRGWTAIRFEGSVPQLRANIAAEQPVIVLLADGRGRYHYVVVIGAAADRIIVHDPAWGPSRSIRETEFVRLWRATNFWSLLVLPASVEGMTGASRFIRTERMVERTDADPGRTASTSEPEAIGCESLLGEAIASIQSLGLASADRVLAGVRAECPESPGPLLELAGVRFAQRRWSEAAALAREAVTLDSADSYAWDILGSSLFMQDDSVGALRAWNHLGRPRVNAVRIEGLRRTRYQVIADALHIETGDVLTAGAFERSRRMLNDLPDRAAARVALRPQAEGSASLDVVLHERSVRPRGAVEWAAVSARAAVDREVRVPVPGITGQGEVWTASWRWWEGRPAIAMSFAAPRGGRRPGLWRVDGSWEAQTYSGKSVHSEQRRRESRAHGSATFAGWMTGALRYAFTGGLDSWDGLRRDASFGASLERRSNGDRVSLAMDGTRWIPLSGDQGFSSVAMRAHFRGVPDSKGWDYRIVSGIERTSDAAPLALWSGAGDGRARTPLLRAHPLLVDGSVDTGNRSAFGRTVTFGSVEGQRWIERPQLPRVGVAGFVDAARASRRFSPGSGTNVDVGGGVRLRLPGWDGALRIDIARGLGDGRNALTVGWLFW
jgi:predicted double-glycine peptidase